MNALKWYLGSAFCFSPEDGGSAAGAGDSGGSSVAVPSTGPADGGGSSQPSPGESPAAPPEASPAGSDKGGDPWANLGSVDDLDYVEIPAQLAPEEPKVPEPPAPPQEPPPVQVPEPKAPPTPQQPPTAAAERPLTAADPWRIAEGLEANRADVIAHLAGTKFALSEDDIKDLDTDVTVAVPKLLSRVFLESQMAMQKFLAQAVPGMIQQYNSVTGANNEAEKKFFDSHKALDIRNPQHRAAAVRIATIYRQANPGIPLDQLISEVGPMVMASLQMNGKMAAPAAKAPSKVAAFRPAVAGGGGAPIATEPANEWAGLGQQYD